MSDIDRVLRSNLKLKHLQLIVALDEFRHLGRSAEFLSLTQPAVSKSLAEIERMFGLTLFQRSTRGTVPTALGQKVVRFARSALADFARTCEDIETIRSGGADRIRVGAMVVATPGLLFDAVCQLKQASPRTTVAVEEGDLSRLLPRLRVGELDFIVGRLEPGYASPDLDTEALYAEPMRVVVAPDHPLAQARQVSWQQLADRPWVVPPAWASSRLKLTQLFYQQRIEPPGHLVETASYLVTTTFLRQPGCVAMVAQDVAEHLQSLGQARMLRIDLPMELPPVGVIQLRGALRTPACDRLLDHLRERARLRQPVRRRKAGAAAPLSPRR